MSRLIAAVVAITFCNLAVADLELPPMFADSMILQRDQPVKVWGWASAGSQIEVSLLADTKSTTTSDDGRWSVALEAMPAGGPHTMTVAGDGAKVVVKDVLIGDVWLCSGQSNMAMTVSRAKDFDKESAAATFPKIRMFKVTSAHATKPQDRCKGEWSVCSPETVGGFSATAYFFGRRIHKELNVPIGLINSSVGGTSVESWTSMPAQSAVAAIKPRLDAWKAADSEYDAEKAKANFDKATESWKQRVKKAKAEGKPNPRRPQLVSRPIEDRNYPSNLFNGKINPLIGYTIKGAVWYQGENSSGRGFAHLYQHQLTTLINDWRTRWGQGDFPFGWVQLPNFKAPQTQPVETSGWVLVQEGMLKTLSLPNTGMAVTIDVGEEKDIHPKDKQSVGHRLAQWALADVYNKDIPAMGPIYRSSKVQGGNVIIEFDHAQGLVADGGNVLGFAIAAEDKKFVSAKARIDGTKVIVSSEAVAEPVSVRYAWAANPVISLRNAAGIPAAPFRTDNWEERGR